MIDDDDRDTDMPLIASKNSEKTTHATTGPTTTTGSPTKTSKSIFVSQPVEKLQQMLSSAFKIEENSAEAVTANAQENVPDLAAHILGFDATASKARSLVQLALQDSPSTWLSIRRPYAHIVRGLYEKKRIMLFRIESMLTSVLYFGCTRVVRAARVGGPCSLPTIRVLLRMQESTTVCNRYGSGG